MFYFKLIILEINDIESNIFCENNYSEKDISQVYKDKNIFEKQGYLCILIKKSTNIIFK